MPRRRTTSKLLVGCFEFKKPTPPRYSEFGFVSAPILQNIKKYKTPLWLGSRDRLQCVRPLLSQPRANVSAPAAHTSVAQPLSALGLFPRVFLTSERAARSVSYATALSLLHFAARRDSGSTATLIGPR